MPLYDFECPKCSEVKECFVFNREEVVECKCGAKMERLPSAPAVLIAHGCPTYDQKHSERMLRDNLNKRKKMYDNAGKQDPGNSILGGGSF